MTQSLDTQQYKRALAQEVRQYTAITNVRDLPKIFAYYRDNYLIPKFKAVGFEMPNDFFMQYIEELYARRAPSLTRPLQIISIGAGNCDIELELAHILKKNGRTNFVITCLEVNANMLQRGQAAISAAGFSQKFIFLQADIRTWKTGPIYDIVVASQSLHHVVDLELLFDKIDASMAPDAYFVTNDMIGRNGHMRWPEAEVHLRALWKLLSPRHTYNQLLKRHEPEFINFDCSTSGFEGIRAQDILPLLTERFYFDRFVGFTNIMGPFVDRAFGHNFDASRPWDRAFIDHVALLDDTLIDSGQIKPTQLIAAMTKRQNRPTRFYKNRSPEFCLRKPD